MGTLLVLGPLRTQRSTGRSFRISFQSDWQIDNGLSSEANHGAYSNPGTQVRDPEQGFRRYFEDGLNQSLVSSVAQAMQSHAHAFHVSRKRNVVAPDKLLLIFTSNAEE